MAMHAESPPRLPLWPRLAAAVPVIALVLIGIWLAGGVLTNDFRLSMALTAAWFGLVAVGAALAWRRVPALRPAALAAVATLVLAGGALALTTLRDKTVDETVAVGPAVLSGSFVSGAHETRGTARIVSAGGGSVLTLTDFRTDAGPDLFVYAVPSGATDSVDGGLRVGGLKGNIGNQQYELPAGLELAPGTTIMIWCRAFSVAFGSAVLGAS
jgi:Electron transfer DM13